jgi:hypothetical protein
MKDENGRDLRLQLIYYRQRLREGVDATDARLYLAQIATIETALNRILPPPNRGGSDEQR